MLGNDLTTQDLADCTGIYCGYVPLCALDSCCVGAPPEFCGHPASSGLPAQACVITALRNGMLSTAGRSMFDRGQVSLMPCFPLRS